MTEGIGVVGLYVHDQDEALDFYVGKLGFQVHTDARNGNYRWLTVKHPNPPSFELGLFLPQEPVLDAATANIMREMVAKGAMPPLVLVVDDCRAAYDKLRAKGVEFIQEPIARFGGVDANFRDPSGNAWKMIQARS
jgi:catechol 2,3-dioxygenase-like lactoylglutathione lyase family enzyme